MSNISPRLHSWGSLVLTEFRISSRLRGTGSVLVSWASPRPLEVLHLPRHVRTMSRSASQRPGLSQPDSWRRSAPNDSEALLSATLDARAGLPNTRHRVELTLDACAGLSEDPVAHFCEGSGPRDGSPHALRHGQRRRCWVAKRWAEGRFAP